MIWTPNQAGSVGESLVSADRGAIFRNGWIEFSIILVKRAEAGGRIDE
jgi:hypothetical protein